MNNSKYKEWFFIGCILLNILLGLILGLIGDIKDDPEDLLAFTIYFVTLVEMTVLQITVSVLGLIFRKHRIVSTVFIVLNLLVLIFTIKRYFF